MRRFEFSGADPQITNDSTATHIIILNLEGDGAGRDPLKINLNSSGGLPFGGILNNQGSSWMLKPSRQVLAAAFATLAAAISPIMPRSLSIVQAALPTTLSSPTQSAAAPHSLRMAAISAPSLLPTATPAPPPSMA